MAKPSPYPFCVDCKHCNNSDDSLPPEFKGRDLDFPLCDYGLSVVTGKREFWTCRVARSGLNVCGLAGRLFEANIEQAKEPA